MIDFVSNFSTAWQYLGPLVGVGFGYLISDRVWDRQKQWEMKRDTLFEAVRALGELHNSLIELDAAYSVQIPDLKDKATSFSECNARMFRAMFSTRLIAGEELCKALTNCINEMRSLSIRIRKGDSTCLYEPKSSRALTEGIKAVLSLARKELKIKVEIQDLDSIS